MSTLLDDAEELERRQDEWNQRADAGVDSAAAAEERALAAEAEALSEALEALAERAAERSVDLSEPTASSAEAAGHMDEAAQAAGRQAAEEAAQSGRAASGALQAMRQQLRARRDAMRDAWRAEVLAALDGAMVETAELAREQGELAERMAAGAAGDDARVAQATLREGVSQVLERLQDAGGKHALVSPRLGAAMGAAGMQMDAAMEQLQRVDPNGPRAAQHAGGAIDALTAGIYQMLLSRAEIEGAESGSGLEEALRRMAEAAEQQSGMNGETGGLFSLGDQASALMQQLQGLAQRERQLADRLDRLGAEGDVGQAEALAEDARDIARSLEAGALDRELLERQERLFRRLLDAGRSLQSDEEDEREERVAETARPGARSTPDAVVPEGGPRYRPPTWEELRGLSPELRKAIVDYFRRLNVPRP
jgi:hypothetical protein